VLLVFACEKEASLLLGQLTSIALQSDGAYDTAFDCGDVHEIGDLFLRVLTGCRHRVSYHNTVIV